MSAESRGDDRAAAADLDATNTDARHGTRSMRPASALDVQAVLVPIDQACRPRPWSGELYMRELENASSSVQVLLVDDAPAGLLVTWWVCDEVEIQNICVHPDFRRQGHAVWMIEQLATDALRRGMATIRLEVRRSNVGARALYGRAGFVELGRRRGYYVDNAEDAILLGFALEPSPSEC